MQGLWGPAFGIHMLPLWPNPLGQIKLQLWFLIEDLQIHIEKEAHRGMSYSSLQSTTHLVNSSLWFIHNRTCKLSTFLLNCPMCSLSKAACLRIDDSPAKLKKYNLNQQLEPVKLFQNDQMMTLVSWTRSNRSNCKIIYLWFRRSNYTNSARGFTASRQCRWEQWSKSWDLLSARA